MLKRENRWQSTLDGYAKFLREKALAFPKHQPFLVRWVKEFLYFARFCARTSKRWRKRCGRGKGILIADGRLAGIKWGQPIDRRGE